MSSIQSHDLVSGTKASGTEQSAAKSTSQSDGGFIAFLKVSAHAPAFTVDGTIQHSPNGTDWFTLATFTQQTTNGTDVQAISASVFPRIRANMTYAGAGSATVEVRVFFDPNKR